jgi:hypothetical protein
MDNLRVCVSPGDGVVARIGQGLLVVLPSGCIVFLEWETPIAPHVRSAQTGLPHTCPGPEV